jgi:hypothetical protein
MIQLGKITIFTLLFFLCLHGQAPAQEKAGDYKKTEPIIDAFMNARMLEHNVAARNLMTAELEKDYLRGKKLSVRVKAGRIAAYDFDPSRINLNKPNSFEVDVRSLWADLNEQVFDFQIERVKFISIRNEWFADQIDLLKKEPVPGLPAMDIENAKRLKLAVAIAKKFARSLVTRNSTSLLQVTSQEFQKKFPSPQVMVEALCGPSDPFYTAFGLKDYNLRSAEEIDFTLLLYQTSKGKRGFSLKEMQLVTTQGSLDWMVTDSRIASSH